MFFCYGSTFALLCVGSYILTLYILAFIAYFRRTVRGSEILLLLQAIFRRTAEDYKTQSVQCVIESVDSM